MTTTATPLAPPARSPTRRIAAWLHRHRGVRLVVILALPLAWLGVVYLGSLFVLFLNAFWTTDEFTSLVVQEFTLDNFVELFTTGVYRAVTLRTVGMAALVTVTCIVLAFPIAFYMAKVASVRRRGVLAVAILMPLWASYLIKAYSWRLILTEEGVLDWALKPLGLTGPGFGEIAVWLVFTYLWLPFMILPIYAGLERIPDSLLEASSDLGGRSWMTFRRVILPLSFPAVVAGSIFTFSLTLGDYIVPGLVSTTQFIGNVIVINVAQDLPFAAAYSLVPLFIIVVYLLIARRLGAFEAF
ncbi:MAG: spermidine/putrescine ABC transporter permease [Chloroflexi bacterium RBG_16_69_14]|nr:MAG: spermidine/putrescine ABC transporter permease [Chloroflexi bacterium RBG_16_69_14]